MSNFGWLTAAALAYAAYRIGCRIKEENSVGTRRILSAPPKENRRRCKCSDLVSERFAFSHVIRSGACTFFRFIGTLLRTQSAATGAAPLY